MSKKYAGIGPRFDIPSSIYSRALHVSIELAKLDYTLRSGAADGMDSIFEEGCDFMGGKKEIFLPEKGFNGHPSKFYVEKWDLIDEARKLAEKYHPNWKACNTFAKNAHTRNMAQVLGWTLDDPVDFVVCYTHNGLKKGGTAQAMRVAEAMRIPIYNLYYDDVENFLKFID